MFSHHSTLVQYFVSAILLKSLLLFAATGALMLAMRRTSASNRALAWQMCLIGMLLLPILSASLPSLRIALPHKQAPIQTLSPIDQKQVIVSEPTAVSTNMVRIAKSVNQAVEPISAAQGSPADVRPVMATSVVHLRLQIDMLIIVIWSVGAVLLFARIGVSSMLLARLRRSSTDAPNSIIKLGRELAHGCGIKRNVGFMIGIDAASSVSPMTWGWFRPVIMLPADAHEWTEGRLRPILLHELGHVARLDWPVLVLADLAASVYWFHPLVWLMRRRLRIECEQACDDSVLAHGLELQLMLPYSST